MATTINKVRNVAPFINREFVITSKWWNERINPVTGETEIHRGLDIATSGLAGTIYAMYDSVVHSKGFDDIRGNWIILYDNDTTSPTYGYAYKYQHMQDLPPYVIGFKLNKGDTIGIEGSTGQSSGRHLHLEMQDISRFNFEWHSSYNKSDYIDPTIFMGIDNIKDTWWLYDGTPHPYKDNKNNKFPWVLYSNRIRQRNLLK